MLKSVLAIAGVSLATVLAACGGSSSSGTPADGGAGTGSGGSAGTSGNAGASGSAGGAGASGIPLGDVPAALAKAYCDLYDKCYGALVDISTPGEDCVTRTQKSIEDGGFNELSSSVSAGTVEYHADLVQACLDAIAGESCDQLLQRGIAACEAAVSGTVDAGGDCTIDADCKGANVFCQGGGTCPGKCTAPLAAGQDCDRDAMCQSGLSCDATTKKCVKPPGLGDACGGGVEAECGPPGVCIGQNVQQSKTGTCKTVDQILTATNGAACSPQDGPWCVGAVPCVVTAVDAGGNVTASCGAKVASGAACHLSIPDQCPTGEYCDITVQQLLTGQTGACQPVPKAGETCAAPLTGTAGCEAYSRCDPTTAKCVPLHRLGEPCSTDLACYSGRCANGGCAPAACGG